MKATRIHAAIAALLALFVTTATAAQDAPFIGVVTDTKLEVRSGAGRAYYVVGELEKGSLISVEKVLFNQTWYQVRVPKGVHSYVSKVFVDAQGDGEKGKINTDKTEFKAASLRGPGESYRVQGTLSEGDTVKIIGEEGNFYKIESPADAYVFIPAGTLRKATAEEIKAANKSDNKQPKDPDPKGTKDPDGKTTDPVDPVDPINKDPKDPDPKDPEVKDPDPKDPEVKDPDPKDPEVKDPEVKDPEPKEIKIRPGEDGWPPVPDVEVKSPAKSEALRNLELQVLPYGSLPLSKQPLDKIAQAYQDLLKGGGLPLIDQQIIGVRLRQLESRQRRLAAIERAKQAGGDDKGLTEVPEEKDDRPVPTSYDAVGLLQPSTVYDGGSLPLLYRIVDPSTNYTLAYVAPSKELNLALMLNKLVGVSGKTAYNQAIKLKVITVNRAVLLEAEKSDDASDEEPSGKDEAKDTDASADDAGSTEGE